MKTIRLALLVLGALFAALLVYYLVGAVVGIVFSLLFYAVVIGAIALAGAAAYKYLTKPEKRRELEEYSPERELDNASRALDEYRRKVLNEKN